VTVHGAKPRKAQKAMSAPPATPEPVKREIGNRPYSIVVTGVGGTGVVTIGAILGMAAHLEGKGCGLIDMSGLAQKGGAVFSHVKLARRPEDIFAVRVAAGDADLILGCDLVVSGAKAVLAAMRGNETGVIVNASEVFPGDFTRKPDFALPTERLKRSIEAASGGGARFVDATAAAGALLGNAIGANMFVLGYAYQSGYVPLSSAAIRRAIELNGEAVAMNLAAFEWGRAASADPASLTAIVQPSTRAQDKEPSLDALVDRRAEFLTAYQNRAYAERYRALVNAVAAAEAAKTPGRTGLAAAAAKYFFKLMAYKDEYEVARLFTEGSFQRQVAEAFEGDLKFEFHLAPPWLARKDSVTGQPKKMTFGPWMMTAFRALAALRVLRGTSLDIFGRTPERREERALIGEYEALASEVVKGLNADNHALGLALLSLPEKIRGYGHVKAESLVKARADEARLLETWRGPPARRQAAE
jgi:indolepyruvate ferredoxin oxidoreductase